MMRSIVVPLDGSPFSEHALPLALGIARATGGVLHLVHVHRPSQVIFAATGIYESRRDDDMEQREQEYLRHIAGRCEESAGVVVRSTLLGGTPAQALAEYAREVEAGLIVMTTHGRSGLSRVWLGSVAGELVRQSSVPVLLLRPQEGKPVVAPAELPRNILIPLDGSELAEQVLEPAILLGSLAGAAYTLLRIVSPNAWVGRPYTAIALDLESLDLERQRAQADHYLKRIADRIPGGAAPVRTAVGAHAQPAAGILGYAAQHGSDLIVMATHARSGLARLALGSVADKVLRGADTPVLLYRPAED